MNLKSATRAPIILCMGISSVFAHPNHKPTQSLHNYSSQTVPSYAPDHLLQQQSSMNEDLDLLQRRQQHAHPYLFSGGIEWQYFNKHNNAPTHNNTEGFALSTAELDAEFMPSTWVTGLIGIDYDSHPIEPGHRNFNGDVSIHKGFITLGNLNKTPVYFTVGKMEAPFGQGSSAMLSSSQTAVLGHVSQPTSLIGYQKNIINAAAFSYQNAAHTLEHGARFGINTDVGQRKIRVSTSYISNIADAAGSQDNGLNSTNQFNGFNHTYANHNGNHLAHDVAGADIDVGVTQGPLSLNGEYVSAIRHFAPQDLSMNNRGAKPRALQLEGDYSWQVGPRPYSVGLRYGESWDTLALNIPHKSVSLGFRTSYWKNSSQAIELRENLDYNKNESSTGAGATQATVGDGLDHFTVTVETGLYF